MCANSVCAHTGCSFVRACARTQAFPCPHRNSVRLLAEPLRVHCTPCVFVQILARAAAADQGQRVPGPARLPQDPAARRVRPGQRGQPGVGLPQQRVRTWIYFGCVASPLLLLLRASRITFFQFAPSAFHSRHLRTRVPLASRFSSRSLFLFSAFPFSFSVSAARSSKNNNKSNPGWVRETHTVFVRVSVPVRVSVFLFVLHSEFRRPSSS